MNYHDIRTDDMLNGSGLRVILFVSGCSHYCDECHNAETWNPESGILFDESAEQELFEKLSKDYISGITFSGGDPLHSLNLEQVHALCKKVKKKFTNKTIWLYTGYKWEAIFYPVITDDFNPKRDEEIRLRREIVSMCDVLVDGKFQKDKADINYHWAGSTNQRVIDVKKSLKENKVILFLE